MSARQQTAAPTTAMATTAPSSTKNTQATSTTTTRITKTPYHQDPVMAAIAWNNIAIDLLKKERYGSALQALRISLSLMQPSTEGSSSSATTIPGGGFSDSSLLSSDDDSNIYMTAEIDVIQENDVASLQAALMFGPSACIMFPIMISESTNHKNENNFSRLEACKHFGIILYNHGLACFLLSCQQQLQSQPEKELAIESYHSLQQAEAVLAALGEAMEKQQQQQQLGRIRNSSPLMLLPLRALVLNFLGLVCHSQNFNDYEAVSAVRLSSQLLLLWQHHYHGDEG